MQSLNKGSELEGKVASLKLWKGIFQVAVAMLSLRSCQKQLSTVCIRSLFTLLFYFRKACATYSNIFFSTFWNQFLFEQVICSVRFFKSPLHNTSAKNTSLTSLGNRWPKDGLISGALSPLSLGTLPRPHSVM